MVNTLKNFKEKVELLSEDYNVIENKDETGNIKGVIIEGLAITFGKPTRNRVSYTYESGNKTHKSLVGKPFLDSHIDKSIHKNPPFGHVIETYMGKNPKNNLPALFYKVDVDPMEETFIRKLKRKDIPGVSVQVLVDSVVEMQDMYGDFLQATIREFLELSAVLIPGDGDTTMRLVESFNSSKKFNESSTKEDVSTSNGSATIGTGGVLPKRKVIRKEPETEEKIYEADPTTNDKDDSANTNQKRFIGKKMEEMDKKKSDDAYEERFSKIESMLEKLSKSMEGLAEGQPEEDKKGKLSGKEKDPENVNQKDGVGMKSIESMIRQVLKEELTGQPERKTGEEKKDIGPKNTSGLPLTEQPENGEAPSGGTIYGDDKMGKTGEDSTKDVPMPKKDKKKPTVQKNSLDEARTLIEKAKSIMKEYAKGDDVTEPQPGRTEEKPREMDDAVPNKESTEACDKKDDSMKKMYESLQNEIKKESSNRKSVIGNFTESSNSSANMKDLVKEYLSKSN